MKRNALHIIGFFSLIYTLVFMFLIYFHPQLGTTTREYVHTLLLMPIKTKQSNEIVKQRLPSKFDWPDFDKFRSKLTGYIGQNLRLRFAGDKKSTAIRRVTVDYTELVFPNVIDTSKRKQVDSLSKKYVYVHYMYNDQLSKNTRALLSLCAQAGTAGRMVVKPFVRKTKFGSDRFVAAITVLLQHQGFRHVACRFRLRETCGEVKIH